MRSRIRSTFTIIVTVAAMAFLAGQAAGLSGGAEVSSLVPTGDLPSVEVPSVEVPSTPDLPSAPSVPSAPSLPSAPSTPSVPSAPDVVPQLQNPETMVPQGSAPTAGGPTGPAGRSAPTSGTRGAVPTGTSRSVTVLVGGRFVRVGAIPADPAASGIKGVYASLSPAARRQARQQRAAQSRRLRRLVISSTGCLGSLPTGERRVLVLRAGIGRGRPRSRARVAARLDISVRRVARLERRGLRRVRILRKTAGCGGGSGGAGQGTGGLVAQGPQPTAGLFTSSLDRGAGALAPVQAVRGIRASGSSRSERNLALAARVSASGALETRGDGTALPYIVAVLGVLTLLAATVGMVRGRLGLPLIPGHTGAAGGAGVLAVGATVAKRGSRGRVACDACGSRACATNRQRGLYYCLKCGHLGSLGGR